MLTHEFHIDVYNYQVHLVQFEDGDEFQNIPEGIRILISDEGREKIEEWYIEESRNCGITIQAGRDIIIAFSTQATLTDADNSYYHEAYHLTRDIVEYLEIDDAEAGAYLHGYIGQHFNKFLRLLNFQQNTNGKDSNHN